jgi:hypothetical protein
VHQLLLEEEQQRACDQITLRQQQQQEQTRQFLCAVHLLDSSRWYYTATATTATVAAAVGYDVGGSGAGGNGSGLQVTTPKCSARRSNCTGETQSKDGSDNDNDAETLGRQAPSHGRRKAFW